MRELRVQHQVEPYRVLYAFDPRRMSILLIGGCKAGDWRDTKRTAQRCHLLAFEEPAHKSDAFIHRFTLFPGHPGSPPIPSCVNHVPGTICKLSVEHYTFLSITYETKSVQALAWFLECVASVCVASYCDCYFRVGPDRAVGLIGRVAKSIPHAVSREW